MDDVIQVAVTGALGRMGRTTCEAVIGDQALLLGGCDRPRFCR